MSPRLLFIDWDETLALKVRGPGDLEDDYLKASARAQGISHSAKGIAPSEMFGEMRAFMREPLKRAIFDPYRELRTRAKKEKTTPPIIFYILTLGGHDPDEVRQWMAGYYDLGPEFQTGGEFEIRVINAYEMDAMDKQDQAKRAKSAVSRLSVDVPPNKWPDAAPCSRLNPTKARMMSRVQKELEEKMGIIVPNDYVHLMDNEPTNLDPAQALGYTTHHMPSTVADNFQSFTEGFKVLETKLKNLMTEVEMDFEERLFVEPGLHLHFKTTGRPELGYPSAYYSDSAPTPVKKDMYSSSQGKEDKRSQFPEAKKNNSFLERYALEETWGTDKRKKAWEKKRHLFEDLALRENQQITRTVLLLRKNARELELDCLKRTLLYFAFDSKCLEILCDLLFLSRVDLDIIHYVRQYGKVVRNFTPEERKKQAKALRERKSHPETLGEAAKKMSRECAWLAKLENSPLPKMTTTSRKKAELGSAKAKKEEGKAAAPEHNSSTKDALEMLSLLIKAGAAMAEKYEADRKGYIFGTKMSRTRKEALDNLRMDIGIYEIRLGQQGDANRSISPEEQFSLLYSRIYNLREEAAMHQSRLYERGWFRSKESKLAQALSKVVDCDLFKTCAGSIIDRKVSKG